MILIAATIAKPTQKSIASTLKPAIDRQLLIANLEEKSIFVLELKWSDEATKIVQLESVEDCYYNGSYIEDPDSTILITGCESKTIQIQSPIFGDYLGTITANGILNVVEDGYLIDDALENPDWNPTSNNVTIPEKKNESELKPTHEEPMVDLDCHCEDYDDECWNILYETGNCPKVEKTENQRKKRSDGDECECGDDDACWETLFQTGECPTTSPEFECGCEDWDKECWKYCLISTIVDAKETEGTAQFIDIAYLFPKVVRILGNIYGEFASDYSLENSEFEGEPECECEDGDDECWINCLELTITIATSNDFAMEETAESFFSSIFGIVKKLFGNFFG